MRRRRNRWAAPVLAAVVLCAAIGMLHHGHPYGLPSAHWWDVQVRHALHGLPHHVRHPVGNAKVKHLRLGVLRHVARVHRVFRYRRPFWRVRRLRWWLGL